VVLREYNPDGTPGVSHLKFSHSSPNPVCTLSPPPLLSPSAEDSLNVLRSVWTLHSFSHLSPESPAAAATPGYTRPLDFFWRGNTRFVPLCYPFVLFQLPLPTPSNYLCTRLSCYIIIPTRSAMSECAAHATITLSDKGFAEVWLIPAETKGEEGVGECHEMHD
jgi:hypothetical protein